MKVMSKTVGQAYDNFSGMFHPSKLGVGYHFWHFLGLKEAPNLDGDDWDFTDEDAGRRVEMLAGSNWQAVAKAMIINGFEPIDPNAEMQGFDR